MISSTPKPSHSNKLLSDQELFTDIVFMWLGPDCTKLAKIDPESKRYIITSAATAKQISIFDELEPCGSLVFQIKQLLEPQSLSHLQQSLKNAIRKQLGEYFSFVGQLRDKQDLMLVDLMTANTIARPQLHLLAQLLMGTQNVKGGELVTKLQHLNHQGSKRISEILTTIYMETVQPLLQMTIGWVTRGETSDPFYEFFINTDAKVADDMDTFWLQKYTLRHEMLPVTFRGSISNKILLVGKNVNFIRRCCRAKEWRLSPTVMNAAKRADFDTIPAVVEDALQCTNGAVMKLLTEKFHLGQLLTDIRAFLLVAYDDFYDPLINRLGSVLGRASSHIPTSAVEEHLQATLRELPNYTTMTANVRAHMEAKDERIVGWDAFMLHLHVPPPLNHVIDKEAMMRYRKLFQVLWKTKCADVLLKNAWRQSVMLDRQLGKMSGRGGSGVSPRELTIFKQLATEAGRLGLELMHFISNLHSYLIYEAIMVSWEKLQQGLKSATSLDDLRTVHSNYQIQLMSYTLLHDECAEAKQIIDSVVKLAREYCVVQMRLLQLVEKRAGEPEKILESLRHVADNFHREVQALLATLEEQHLKFDFLHFLGLRLNFNRFYRLSDEGGAVVEQW